MEKHNRGVERAFIDRAAKIAVESHKKQDHVLGSEGREMKKNEHTGIELTEGELAYFRKMVVERLEGIANEEELSFLEDLEKKLFEKKETTDAI